MRTSVFCVFLTSVACGDKADDSAAPVGDTATAGDGGGSDGGASDGGGDGGADGGADGGGDGGADGGADGGGDGGADGGGEDGGGDGGEDSLPLDGFGTITGDCDAFGLTELTSADPYLFRNAIDFGEEAVSYETLSASGQVIYDAGNLGGSSIWSEIFAFEVLYRCELAALEKTEADINYRDAGGKKTDLMVILDGETIGVSVTRAYHYPPDEPYTVEYANELLNDKLADVLLSSANVDASDAWTKQILSVIAYEPGHADSIEAAWADIDSAVKADTILVVTVTDGNDEALY